MKTKNILASLVALTLINLDVNAQSCSGSRACNQFGPELIVNGDFNAGNTGFTSSYNYLAGCAPGGIYGNGNVWQKYNINGINTCYGINDRNGANGRALHFPDILDTDAGMLFWSQTVNVMPGQSYNFSFFVYEPGNNCPYQPGGTKFDVYINGILICTDDVGNCNTWNQKLFQWFSGPNTTAKIEIRNGFTNYTSHNPPTYHAGMDPFFDGISMRQCTADQCEGVGRDLIVNGDFSMGNTAFTSGYNFFPGCATGGLFGNGLIWTTYNIRPVNTCYGIWDRNGADGEAMHFPDIQNTDPGRVMWGQNVPVTPFTNYKLSFYVYEPSANAPLQSTGTLFDLYINGSPISIDQIGFFDNWVLKSFQWNSGPNPMAIIEIRNGFVNNVSISPPNYRAGMDPLIDGISMVECIPLPAHREITGLNESKQSIEWNVAPNPSKGVFKLNTTRAGIYNVAVFNSQGALLQKTSFTGSVCEIDLTQSLKGIYYVVIDGADGRHESVTIMKE